MDFISKCDQIRNFLRICITFTKKILHKKLYFLCSDDSMTRGASFKKQHVYFKKLRQN